VRDRDADAARGAMAAALQGGAGRSRRKAKR